MRFILILILSSLAFSKTNYTGPKKDILKDYIEKATEELAYNRGVDVEQLRVQSVDIIEDPTDPIKNKWRIHIIWGYNRAWHANSTAVWKTSGGTFTIHDAQAKDRPTPLSWLYIDPTKFSIPQYNFRAGMEKDTKIGSMGFEIGTDHMKWVFDNSKNYKISGDYTRPLELNPNSGLTQVDFDRIKETGDASPLNFEYSDGHNYVHLSAFYNVTAFKTNDKKFQAMIGAETGLGAYVPKPHVRILNNHNWYEGENGKFQLAGYGFHIGAKARFTFFEKFFIESSLRGIGIKSKATIYSPQPIVIEQELMKSVQIYAGVGFIVKNFNKN